MPREPFEGTRADGDRLLVVPLLRVLTEGTLLLGVLAAGEPVLPVPREVGVLAEGVRDPGALAEGFRVLGDHADGVPAVDLPLDGVRAAGVREVPAPTRAPSEGLRGLFTAGVVALGVPVAPRLAPGTVLAVSVPGVPRLTAPPFLDPSVPGWVTVRPEPSGLCLVTAVPVAVVLPLGLA